MASLWILVSSLLFALMGVCIKFASAYYSFFELVAYRGVIGLVFIAVLARTRGGSLRTAYPMMHFWRSAIGVTALMMWFFALANLPLATGITLNYTSSLWMAAILAVTGLVSSGRGVSWRLTAAVLTGFVGVALLLRPTLRQDQLGFGMVGLLSGMVSAMAYLQVAQLGKVGEPEYRVVFYFSLASLLVGAVGALLSQGGALHTHTWHSAGLLLAMGLLASIAQMALTRAYTFGKPLVNASLQYAGVIFASFFGFVFFGDRLDWLGGLGIVFIIAGGVAATVFRPRADAPDTVISNA
ncbi:MAG: DMT family transporter [Betaproteobacteria bacterium]|nr:DMT family transporter [Betaproteobacteria bacterium]